MTTLRQIEANRLNAQKSTGPTSDEGKARSRANALTHGLTGSVLTAETDAEAVRERMTQWRDSFAPRSAEQEWLYEQVVVSSVRVDRCRAEEQSLRCYESLRASLCWDDDRRLDAEETALALSRKPASVSRRLRRTRQGAEWLLGRWHGLGAVLERGESWNEAQVSLAFDLLGTPPDRRDGDPWAGGTPADLVAREVASLRDLIADALEELDDFERESAELGLPVEPSRALARLRRYEAACLRRYQWARARLLDAAPAPAPGTPPPSPPRPLPSPPPPMSDDEREIRALERAFLQSVDALTTMTDAPPPPPADPADPAPPAPSSTATPAAPAAPALAQTATPAPSLVPAPRPMNRKARRAVAKLAAARR